MQMLSAGRAQGLVRPVTSHERDGCSHDVGVVPASPPARVLPISRRASEPVAKSGVDALRVERISLDFRDHPWTISTRSPSGSTRATTTRTHPRLRSLRCGPALDLGPKPELDPALPEIEYGLRHIVIALLVLVDGVPVREAEDVGHTLSVD
jgi:hypothetical protein